MTDIELYEEVDDRLPTPAQKQREAEEEVREISERVSRLSQELVELASTPVEGDDPSQALVTRDASPGAKKRELGVMRARAARRAQEIESKREEIREASREMERAMSKQMELAKEALAPLEKYMARLEEGIWMVNLYLGRDEEILMLQDGDPAPANEVVTIRQLVLYMDEECAINPDGDGIDATQIEAFDEWLVADPRHLDQVLPERKGVVALKPRRHGKQYTDPWKQMVMDKENARTYFLIRNGEKAWRTWTEFDVGARLVPLADEFGSFFYEKQRASHSLRERGLSDHRIPIEPGTKAWEEAEEAADARQRHYMRVGLILQGLVDRTTVFHPLPEGGINFMDFNHSNKTWRFVIDAENLIESGRQPYREWLRERAEMLQVGMRIVGTFNRWDDGERYRGNVRPPGASLPPSNELLVLDEKGPYSGSFLVRYNRTDKVWSSRKVPVPDRPGWVHTEGYVEPKRRASMIVDGGDHNIIPFDLVTEEEMLAYLNARLDRHNYAEMFPLLKAAVRAKRVEREEERPFRTMMVGVLARENGVSAEEAESLIDDLISWWKTGNRWHRPLIGGEESQAKAVRALVAEHARRLRVQRRGSLGASVIESIKGQNPQLIAILQRRSNGHLLAVTPERHELYTDVDYTSPYVRIDEYTATGRRHTKGEKRWFMLAPSWLSRLDVVLEGDQWDAWPKNASDREHLSGPELERLYGAVRDRAEGMVEAIAYDPHKKNFYLWTFEKDAQLDASSPFTATLREPIVQETVYGWMRRNGEAQLNEHRWGSSRPNYIYQTRPWDTRPRDKRDRDLWWDDEKVSAEELAVNKYVVLYVDEALVQRYDEQKAAYAQVSEALEGPRRRVRSLLASIERQWVERKERAEYDRFLEDYLDPELWEGHKKALPQGFFSYPHSHYRSWRREPDALALMIEYHIEMDMPIVGLTVWEATENFPPVAWIKDRLQKEQEWWGKAPKATDIPEDIRDLRFEEPSDDD